MVEIILRVDAFRLGKVLNPGQFFTYYHANLLQIFGDNLERHSNTYEHNPYPILQPTAYSQLQL